MIIHQPANSRGNYNYNSYTYANFGYPAHIHKNFELIYVIDKEVILTVNGRVEHVPAGAYALILPNQVHSIEYSKGARAWIAVFSTQFIPHFANRVENHEGVCSTFRCSDSVDEFLKENLIFSEGSITMKKACFYAACDQYLKCVPLQEKKAKNNELICNIIDYIENHFKEKLSLQSVSAEFGYEYHYVSRILNQQYNINFTNLVNEYRIDCAIDMLENTEKSITDIAMESGFQSLRNFNHVFKQITGKSPLEYIKG